MSIFVCSKCQAQFSKWFGQCSQCEAWGTINKQNQEDLETEDVKTFNLERSDNENITRIKTGIEEFDRVLGGGIVPSSVILFAGQPGIGKSTLVLQIAQKLSGQQVLYASGEESVEQVKLRLERLNVSGQNLRFLGQTDIKSISGFLKKYKPGLIVIDSIQTISPSHNLRPGAGGPNQIRAAAGQLIELAKQNQTAMLIIGHVTKEGVVAGPKTLEHLVDTVLYLEGDPYHYFRFLRAVKNRFGSTNEIGVFEMRTDGLREIKNPSASFLADRDLKISGSVVGSLIQGNRSFLIEVQALVTPSVFKQPQRKCSGFDSKRLSLLIAVIGRRLGLNLSNKDIHINIVGGLQVNEPAIDLPVILAIVSAFKNIPVSSEVVSFGEVGLGGEVRPVPWMEKRVKEAVKIGFKKIICPQDKNAIIGSKAEIIQVKNLTEAIARLW